MFLQALDEPLPEIIEVDGLIGDFAQGDHRVLVLVAIEGQFRAGRNAACPLRGQHDQLKAVWNLGYTIFNRYSGHYDVSKDGERTLEKRKLYMLHSNIRQDV